MDSKTGKSFPFDVEVTASSIKSFAESTGFDVYVFNDKGSIVMSSNGKLHLSEFCCRVMQGNLEDKCNGCHINAIGNAASLGDAYIFNCPAGLTLWAAPLMYEKKAGGALFCGPVLLMPEGESSFDAEVVVGRDYINNEEIKEELRKLPVVDKDRIRRLSQLLLVVANYLNKYESEILEERKRFFEQQARLSEEIQSIKERLSEYEHGAPHDYFLVYMPLERELASKVRFGDKQGARALLNAILGQIYFYNGGNTELIKARLMELVVVLSRAVVEGGAQLEIILGLNLRFLDSFSRAVSVEEMCYSLTKIFDRFIDHIFNAGSTKNYQVIQSAIDFIRHHYNRDITLEETAASVNLSPGYFCTLFKEELGMNFSDYLNKLRIEESKKLLQDVSLSILEVSQEVGFNDQSYFCKVFKKLEGVSPSQYRRRINNL